MVDDIIPIRVTFTAVAQDADGITSFMLRGATHGFYEEMFPDPRERADWLRWMNRLTAKRRNDPTLLQREVTTPPIGPQRLRFRAVGEAAAIVDRVLYVIGRRGVD